MNIKQKKLSLIKVSAAAIVIALLIGGWFVYAQSRTSELVTQDGPVDNHDATDYSPPTEQEVKSSQDAKKRDNQESDSSSNSANSSSKQTVTVGVSYADVIDDKLEIRAFTQSIIEGTGTCTASATKDGSVVKKSSKAFVDATSSICNPIYIPVSDLEPGIWDVSIRFTSPDATGSSDTVKVEVR